MKIKMNIQLNNKTIELKNSMSIEVLINLQNISSKGIAVALNSAVVTKSEWSTTLIKANDNIMIITATQGG
tara:strand:- start:1460 stop:1672 length:213 start_codon:yes stop_codon:yes gene_type:complete